MNGFLQDVRHALRMLRKNPVFAATAVITLALGIGANTAIFSVVNSVLLAPLPYGDPDRLLYLNTTSTTFGPGLWPMSPPIFDDFRQQNQVLEGMSATRNVTMNVTDGEETQRLEAARVSANMLRVLGLQPYLGRDFADREDAPGAAPVALLSYNLWQSRFGGRANVMGETVGLDGVSYTIVGVLPAAVRFPDDYVSLWIPFVPSPTENMRANFFIRPYGRLKPGVSLHEAEAQMKTIAARLAKQYPTEYGTGGIELLSLRDRVVGDFGRALWILFGAVGCVLLIACANIANLLLARAAGRSSELAIRSALGADRRRLLRQLLTESVMLSLIGAALGLLLAVLGVQALVGLAGTSMPGVAGAAIPRAGEIHLDLRVLGFTLALGLAAGIFFGLFPAMQISRDSLSGAMRDGGRRGGTRGAAYRRALGALVTAEVAVSLVLLAGAGLMLRSFAQLQQVRPGFSPENVVTFEMGASRLNYPGNERQADFYQRVVEKVRTLPGVESAAAAHRVPLVGMATTGYQVQGRPVAPGTPGQNADIRAVTPGLFQTLKIPLQQGRDFSDRDIPGAPDVIVVSETVARREWPGENPIGKRVQLGALVNRWWEVVGVVGDVKYRGLDRENSAAIYWSMKQQSFPNWLRAAYLVVRTKNDPLSSVGAIRGAVHEVDRGEGLAAGRTLEDVMRASLGQQKMNLGLLLVFAGIAAVLAAVGIYGVMSYSVTERTQEIGVRIALGASRGNVLGMVLRQGMTLVLLGVAAGLAGSLALARVIQTLLFRVAANDPSTLVSVSVLLTAVAALAIYVPALRATRVDPVIALRNE